LEKRAPLAYLSSPTSGGWLVVSPNGLFDGSPGAWSDIIWRFGKGLEDVLPVEAFFADFFYPGLLSDIVAGKNPKGPRELSQVDRRQPTVSLSLADANMGPISSRTVTLLLSVKEAPSNNRNGQPSGARDLRLFRNGSLVKIWHGENVSTSPYQATVPIVAGNNSFTAYAFNDSNVKSRDAQLMVMGAESLGRKGTAYIIAIGINRYSNHNFDLRYAAQDAETFSRELSQKQIELGTFSHIEPILLLDRDAQKQNILAALERLAGVGGNETNKAVPEVVRNLKPAEPEDAIFVYFAGHGVSANAQFYMVPYDLGYTGRRDELDEKAANQILANSISDGEVLRAVEGIDAGTLVMIIDACNSGQALESEEKRRGPMNSKGLAQLAYEKGMFVLTASEGYQAALEDAKLGHGILTYALVEEGLKTADADEGPKDHEVTVREWLEYAARRVPEIQQSLETHTRELEHVEPLKGDKSRKQANGGGMTQHPRLFYRREQYSKQLVVNKIPEEKGDK
jgi:GTP cyclohydrolase II